MLTETRATHSGQALGRTTRNDDDAGVLSLDLDGLLCPDRLPCPARIDGVEVRISGWDQTHFTRDGARWIAPTIVAAITRLASRTV